MDSNPKNGRIIVFSAPSGAGKTSLLDHIRRSIPELVYSISATTRPPRPNEVDGVHYFFMNENDFKKRIEKDEFAEWQTVHGNYYGTPRSFIDRTVDKGLNIVMDIDVYGKIKFDKTYPQATGVLILPPSIDVLEARLRGRGTDSETSIKTRLENAIEEMEFASSKGKYQYTVINDDYGRAKEEILTLVKKIIGE